MILKPKLQPVLANLLQRYNDELVCPKYVEKNADAPPKEFKILPKLFQVLRKHSIQKIRKTIILQVTSFSF